MNEGLLKIFSMNFRSLLMNLEGITHEESLIRVNGVNSINWVLGHILLTRDEFSCLTGLDKICSDEMNESYKRGSDSSDVKSAINFDSLMKMFSASQTALENKLNETDFSTDTEKSTKLFFYAFHESYHAGQFGILRRLTGKKGAI